ncbi:MAG: hypothetical protein ABW174_07595 [Flavitalea sp.]
MPQNSQAISTCLRLIEEKLKRGSSENWTSYDFEKVSEHIQEKTGVLLSITTLKRLWGRLKYDSLPSVTTLNALASFLDHTDWSEFCQKELQMAKPEDHAAETNASRDDATIVTDVPRQPTGIRPEDIEGNAIPESQNRTTHFPKTSFHLSKYWMVSTMVLLLLAVLFSLTINRDPVKILQSPNLPSADPKLFSFKANKIISDGVPNSVIFNYDAKAATSDSVYIVQTWDMSRKTLVSRTGTSHSAIYYYPGFFQTKLIADGRVMRTHDLQITSDGWLCLAENDPVPIYFRKEQYLKKDRVEVGNEVLKAFNLSLYPKPPQIRFFHQGEMGNLMNDNFVFETTIKNELNAANACQKVEILIQCKNDVIIIPLAAKPCVGDLSLYAAGAEANSKTADLSRFGCDLNKWTTLRVECAEKKMSFFVNGIKAHSLTFPNPPTGIVGVQYRFTGPAAVKDTRFSSEGKLYKL